MKDINDACHKFISQLDLSIWCQRRKGENLSRLRADITLLNVGALTTVISYHRIIKGSATNLNKRQVNDCSTFNAANVISIFLGDKPGKRPLQPKSSF